jgi:hypothetical protein
MSINVDMEAKVGRRLRKSMEFALTFGAFLFALATLIFGVANTGVIDFLEHLLPVRFWMVSILTVSVMRGVVIYINGIYPHTFRARHFLSTITLALLWLPLVTSFILEMILVSIEQGSLQIYPRVILSPLVAGAEVLVLFALTALEEARRDNARTSE